MVEFDDNLLSPLERKLFFDEIYKGTVSLKIEDDLFKKSSKKLDSEGTEYTSYHLKLRLEEAGVMKLKTDIEIRNAEIKKLELDYEIKEADAKKLKLDFEMKEANLNLNQSDLEAIRKFRLARSKFIKKACGFGMDPFYRLLLFDVCISLGPLLFDFVDDDGGRLAMDKKVLIARQIIDVFGEGNHCKFLLKVLGLSAVKPHNLLIPRRKNGQPHAPSSMNGNTQIIAAEEDSNCNFIYAFPFEIAKYFPVFFCHPIFADFMDILHDRNVNNPVVIEYNQFMVNNLEGFKKKLDRCLSYLIEDFLDYSNYNDDQDKFVANIASAMRCLFSDLKVQSELQDSEIISNQVKMDAAITINNFPFIILEAKNNGSSVNVALQGFQCYGIIDTEFIDNDPCFLITFDRGILHLYGMAKVNRRVVCTCLLSLEFTNYQFNVGGFNDTLYRFVSGLYFFYKKIEDRMGRNRNLEQDSQHKKYSAIKSAISSGNQPLPAIFSVQSESNHSERVGITFQTVMRTNKGGEIRSEAHFNPCVYLVKTEDGRDAVLKLACDYDIEAHRTLSGEQLAPQIIGYEKLWNRYHVILMEYFDSSYDTIFKYLSNALIRRNRDHIINSLQNILLKLQSLNLVHGDFRSVNILAKRSENDPSILEDFKLVDFELSGKVNEPYPFLALKSRRITWPDDFESYMPRRFEHDQFMLNQIQREIMLIDEYLY